MEHSGKSMKNALYILRYAKWYLLGIKQQKKVESLLLDASLNASGS